MKNKRPIIPRSVVSKLTNIVVIAVGNILIVAGESLIRYGKDNISNVTDEESRPTKSIQDSDDFFGL